VAGTCFGTKTASEQEDQSKLRGMARRGTDFLP